MGVKQLLNQWEAIKVRPLTGAADEEGVSTPQSVGFKLTILKLTGTACLTLSLISILTINLVNSDYGATPALAAGFTATGPATISISTSGNVDLGSITSNGNIKTASHTLTIKTNAVKGYNVTLSSNSEQTGLVNNKDSTTTTIPTITTNGTLANNTWGYSIDSGSNGSTTTTYQPIKPKSTIPADIIASSTNPTSDTGNAKTITYGVNIPDLNTMKAGTYEAHVVYTATANIPAAPTITKVEPNTINVGESKIITITGQNLASTYEAYIDFNNNNTMDSGETCSSSLTVVSDTAVACIAPAYNKAGAYNVHILAQGGESETNNNSKLTYREVPKNIFTISYMQDMSSDICNSTTTPDASVAYPNEVKLDTDGTHHGDTSYVPEKTLVDKRDNKTYKVRKLADGNCWMVENLALGRLNNTMDLTNQNTDLNSQTSWIMPASTPVGAGWGSASINDPRIIQGSTSANNKWEAGMGNWYTWGAATAGTAKNAITDGAEATDSICPKGWQLPGNDGSKSSANLTIVTYGISSNNAGSAKARSAPLSFALSGAYISDGSINDVGGRGYYWSSIAKSGVDVYGPYFDEYSVEPSGYSDRKYYAYSVRCVAR